MDLFDVFRACFRRWYAFFPVLLAAGAFAFHTYSTVKPLYYANAVVGLAPPNTQVTYAAPGEAIPRNGLLDSGGTNLIANLVTLGLDDPAVRAAVVANGGSETYSSKMFPTPQTAQPLPLIMVETSQPSPELAAKTTQLVLEQVDPTLRSIQQQAGVRPDEMVRALVASPPTPPIPGMPSRTGATLGIFAAGAGLAVVLAVIVDVVALRRSSRRRNISTAIADSTAKTDRERR